MKTDTPTPRDRSLLRNRNGFTLIEVMAVLVLLSIVSAVAYGKFAAPIGQSRNDGLTIGLVRDLDAIQKSFQTFQMSNNGNSPGLSTDITPYLMGASLPASIPVASITFSGNGSATATGTANSATAATAICTRFLVLYPSSDMTCSPTGTTVSITKTPLVVAMP